MKFVMKFVTESCEPHKCYGLAMSVTGSNPVTPIATNP